MFSKCIWRPCLWVMAMIGFAMITSPGARAAVYQWSATIDEVTARESKKPPRAFLWVPENCQRVRAVVIAIQNMQEEQVFENAAFRKTLSDLGFAVVWITPPMGTNDLRFDQGEDRVLEGLLKKLADESGYSEIATAPLVPLGHSASASWCYDVAAWKPERVLCVVSLSGQWPYFTAPDFWGDRSVDTVPALTTKGEFEVGGSLEKGWYAGLKKDFYVKHPAAAFTQVVEPGDGHFAASDQKIELVNLFLRKAVQYRMPADAAGDGPVTLTPIDASKMGWRYEVWHLNEPPKSSAAPVDQFKGKLDQSFWAFDEEMARAIEKFQGTERNKLNTMIGYRQKAGLTQPSPDHITMHLKFEPIDDTLKFKLTGGFFDTVPTAKTTDGKPAGWQRMLGNYERDLDQGAPIDHPTGQDDKMKIDIICGPGVQISKDTFAVRFDRIGMDNPKRCSSVCFILTYPGDDKFKRMVQQGEVKFPLTNTKGTAQTIDFLKIADIDAAALKPVQLYGKATSKLPVYYYVREGPAEVDDNGQLTFTAIPPRAKYPIAVTVVAWQWGRSAEPRVMTADPVERTFMIKK